MTKKQKIDLISSLLFLGISCLFLFLPLFNFTSLQVLLCIFMGFVAIISLIRYFLTKSSKDYDGIYTFFVASICFLFTILKGIEEPKQLAMLVVLWTIGMSMCKLKKSDFYHDRRNRLWKLKLLILCFFIFLGLITSMNLYYSVKVQMLLLGYFFLVQFMLESIEPFVQYLYGRKE